MQQLPDCFEAERCDSYSDADPTHGDVDYLSREEATGDANLARVVDGQAIMSVDNSTNAFVDGQRKSVRISTADPVSFGDLIVLDAQHMPTGCSTWPGMLEHTPCCILSQSTDSFDAQPFGLLGRPRPGQQEESVGVFEIADRSKIDSTYLQWTF